MITQAEAARRTKAIGDLVDVFGKGVRRDGGQMRLVDADVDAGVVAVELSGACASCALSSKTLHQNFERVARQLFPWVTEVKGSVDKTIDANVSRSLGRGGYLAIE